MAKNTTSFKKGATGNPAGRPPGTTPRAHFRDLVKADLPEIVKTLIESAKAGDIQAIKTVLDRTIPTLKATTPDLNIRVTGTLSEQGQAFISAMTKGTVTPDQALVVLNTLSAQSKLIEQAEVNQRLDKLEELLSCRTGK